MVTVDWRKKLGAHRAGVHPLLVETADHIEHLERQLAEARACDSDELMVSELNELRLQLGSAAALLQDYARIYPNNSGRTTKFLARILKERE